MSVYGSPHKNSHFMIWSRSMKLFGWLAKLIPSLIASSEVMKGMGIYWKASVGFISCSVLNDVKLITRNCELNPGAKFAFMTGRCFLLRIHVFGRNQDFPLRDRNLVLSNGTFAKDPPVTDARPFRMGEYPELDPLVVLMKSVIGVAQWFFEFLAGRSLSFNSWWKTKMSGNGDGAKRLQLTLLLRVGQKRAFPAFFISSWEVSSSDKISIVTTLMRRGVQYQLLLHKWPSLTLLKLRQRIQLHNARDWENDA